MIGSVQTSQERFRLGAEVFTVSTGSATLRVRFGRTTVASSSRFDTGSGVEKAKLISRARDAQWRPCKLEPEALGELEDWLAHYRRA